MAHAVMARTLLATSMCLGGAVLTTGLSGCSCSSVTSWSGLSAKFTATRTSTATHVAGKPLRVTTGNGNITITRTGVDTVTIVAKIKANTQARLDAVTIVVARAGDDTLDIKAQWPGNKRESNEGCTFEVQIPDATNLTLETANGAIVIGGGGFNGLATLDTSNGDITVEGHDGKVNADTSNGSIVLHDVPEAKADTSNGGISIRLTDTGAGPVVADSSNGSVHLFVGRGFAGEVDCDTSNGRVSCDASWAKVIRKAKTSGTYSFGATDAAKSSLSTSNGNVTISAK
jgi:DUF4097 and DUF4098 domain-containing protein YvlB